MTRVLVVLGEGGHTRQMLQLLDRLGPQYEYHYLIAAEDRLSEGKIRRPGPVYRAGRPRSKVKGHTDSLPAAAWHTLRSLLQLAPLLRRMRPQAVLANGPALAVPAALLGKLLGAAIIYVESASRVQRMSTSGRLVYPFADLFIVQWPELQAQHRKAIYAGRLL
jgi:beta-1,4-N-acetylglucosaminyltransferase